MQRASRSTRYRGSTDEGRGPLKATGRQRRVLHSIGSRSILWLCAALSAWEIFPVEHFDVVIGTAEAPARFALPVCVALLMGGAHSRAGKTFRTCFGEWTLLS